MIKLAALKDAARLAELHAQGFDRPWPITDFIDHLKTDTDCVLLSEHGFAIARIAVDQAEILTITVAHSARGKGEGARLLGALETAVAGKGASILFLDVAEDNIAAIRLYTRAGFTQIGTRPGYYRRPKGRVAARLYQKRLPLP